MSTHARNWCGALRRNWRSYAAEAFGVTLFMIASCGTAVLLHHPDLPGRRWLGESALNRRVVQALLIGVVLIPVNTNAWAKRSGAHINPAITLAFRSMNTISAVDAGWYIVAQCAAAVVSGRILFDLLATWYPHTEVNFNLSGPKPGFGGWPVALLAEFLISALLMFVTLVTLHNNRLRAYSSWFGIVLIMLFIVFEAPFSGMSTNPARSLGTAAAALSFDLYWIYVLAPVSAMLLTTFLFRRYWLPARAGQTSQPAKASHWYRPDTAPPVFPVEQPDA